MRRGNAIDIFLPDGYSKSSLPASAPPKEEGEPEKIRVNCVLLTKIVA